MRNTVFDVCSCLRITQKITNHQFSGEPGIIPITFYRWEYCANHCAIVLPSPHLQLQKFANEMIYFPFIQIWWLFYWVDTKIRINNGQFLSVLKSHCHLSAVNVFSLCQVPVVVWLLNLWHPLLLFSNPGNYFMLKRQHIPHVTCIPAWRWSEITHGWREVYEITAAACAPAPL